MSDSENPENSQGQPSYYASVFTQTLQLWMDHLGMAELMVDPALGKMAAELAGVQGIRICRRTFSCLVCLSERAASTFVLKLHPA